MADRMAKPEPLYESRYQMELGCVLNVLTFLCPDDWEELLAWYHE